MATNNRERSVKSKWRLPEQFGTDAMTRKMFWETLERANRSRRLLDRTALKPLPWQSAGRAQCMGSLETLTCGSFRTGWSSALSDRTRDFNDRSRI